MASFRRESGQAGQFKRADSVFRDRITADGSSGFKAEPGRYHLYAAHGCPWAHRTLIYHTIKKLEGIVSVAYAIPGLKQNGWTFERDHVIRIAFPTRSMAFTTCTRLMSQAMRPIRATSRSRHCGTRRRSVSSITSWS